MGAGCRMVLRFLICRTQTIVALTSWDCWVTFMWDTDGESSKGQAYIPDAELRLQHLWPHEMKSRLTGKDPDAGED